MNLTEMRYVAETAGTLGASAGGLGLGYETIIGVSENVPVVKEIMSKVLENPKLIETVAHALTSVSAREVALVAAGGLVLAAGIAGTFKLGLDLATRLSPSTFEQVYADWGWLIGQSPNNKAFNLDMAQRIEDRQNSAKAAASDPLASRMNSFIK